MYLSCCQKFLWNEACVSESKDDLASLYVECNPVHDGQTRAHPSSRKEINRTKRGDKLSE